MTLENELSLGDLSEGLTVLRPDVLIIGGGPSGLTAAAGLAGRVPGEVLVLEREREAGGIPRHSDHLGYGMRDLKRFISGPAYARKLLALATKAGATIQTETMVTEWAQTSDGVLSVIATGPGGRIRIEAKAIVLATGARERPRPARYIPGDRPAGVFTTGHLQNLVHLNHQQVGTRAVIVGAELVSWSAVLTLRHAQCKTVLMTSTYPSPESYAAFNIAGKTVLHVPISTNTRLTRIIGRPRVTGVELEDLTTGKLRIVDCDTVILTGDWIPDNELARLGNLDLDPGTRGPAVDAGLRTSRAGVFAVGNLLHPVDTADIAAIDGRQVVDSVLRFLDSQFIHGQFAHVELRDGAAAPAERPAIRIRVADPIRWVAPNVLGTGDQTPARNRLLFWTNELIRFPKVTVSQNGRVLSSRRTFWPASPGRVFRVPASILKEVDPQQGDVTISLGSGRPS